MRQPHCTLALIVALVGALAAFAPLQASSPPDLAFELSIAPGADGTFLCQAIITNRESGEEVARPQLRFRDGERATLEIGGEIGGIVAAERLRLVVEADRGTSTAAVQWLWLTAGKEIELQSVRVRLR